MPLSLLEALNLGKPVLASRIGGLPEIIQEGKNGYLFNPGEATDLAEKINLLKENDLNKIAQFARQSVQNLSPENNLQQVMAVYEEVLSKHK
jgi:glycosyltransferase involved in cell wall biosynthesis